MNVLLLKYFHLNNGRVGIWQGLGAISQSGGIGVYFEASGVFLGKMPWYNLHDLESMGIVIGHPCLQDVVNDYIAVYSLVGSPPVGYRLYNEGILHWLMEMGVNQGRMEFQRCSHDFFMDRVARHGSLQCLFQALTSEASVAALTAFATAVDEVIQPQHFSYRGFNSAHPVFGVETLRMAVAIFRQDIFDGFRGLGEETLVRVSGNFISADNELDVEEEFLENGTREYIDSYGYLVVRFREPRFCLDAIGMIAQLPSLLHVVDGCLDAQGLEDMHMACMMGQHVRLGWSSQFLLLSPDLLMQIVLQCALPDPRQFD